MFDTMNKIEFGTWIQQEREKKGFSQSELARLSGLNRSLINNVESGVSQPSLDTLKALSHGLGYPTKMFLEFLGYIPAEDSASPKKRELLERLKNVDDTTTQLVIDVLDAAVRNQQRRVPEGINPKTTPR